ncbi:hypothetical protein P5663_06870 [Priestia flexa]|uniref:hypothetical protein n=1 Tax=Priestia flexa TaxID=86664 RepID=UPI00240D8FC9|nr:hypothetical protein [Priestia flexa]WEZ09561.1 hypothetical protein P5663_06870 [Priestia flexa]
MKLDNISEGQIFKNYKALCSELGVKVYSGGNAKKAQLKEFERYFDYYREGNKYIVKEIYDEPKPKIDGRGKSPGSRRNNSVYDNYIQLLIADMLATSNKNELSVSTTSLLEKLNMINKNYKLFRESVEEIVGVVEVEKILVHDFYNTSGSSLKNTLERALNDLDDKRVAYYQKIMKVFDKRTQSHRQATKREEELIKHTYEKETLKWFPEEYQSMKKIRVSKHWKNFNKQVMKRLNEETDIEYYYSAYLITINEKYIAEERDKLRELVLSGYEREGNKGMLNAIVQESLCKAAENRHENAIYSKSKIADVRWDENYPNKFGKLVDWLINDQAEDMREVIKKQKEEVVMDDAVNLDMLPEKVVHSQQFII